MSTYGYSDVARRTGQATRDPWQARALVLLPHVQARCSLDLDQFAARVGWDASLVDLKSHLRCSRCGSRDVQTSLVYQPPPSSAVGYISLRS